MNGSREIIMDTFSKNKIKVYHASEQIVKYPQWDYKCDDGITKTRKDFGEGFYVCENPEYPIALYSDRYQTETTVYLNEYIFDTTGLEALILSDNLYWVMVVAAHRRNFKKHTPWHEFRDAIKDTLGMYQLITGPISNDCLFSTMNLFLENLCTDEVLLECMRYVEYPLQYVTKCDYADKNFKWVEAAEIFPKKLRESFESLAKRTLDMEDEIKKKQSSQRRNIRERKRAGEIIAEGRLFEDILSDWEDSGKPKGKELQIFLGGL